MKLALLLVLLAGPAAAQRAAVTGFVAPVAGPVALGGLTDPFTRKFVAAVAPLLSRPFYASRLLQSFEAHAARVAAAPSAAEAASYLRGEALAEAEAGPKGLLESMVEVWLGPPTPAEQVRRVREELGSKPISERQAGAMLLANALTVPDQFRGILRRLESEKPGLGGHFSRVLRGAGSTPDSNPAAAAFLHAAGDRVGPITPYFETYDSKGRLDAIFDGSR